MTYITEEKYIALNNLPTKPVEFDTVSQAAKEWIDDFCGREVVGDYDGDKTTVKVKTTINKISFLSHDYIYSSIEFPAGMGKRDERQWLKSSNDAVCGIVGTENGTVEFNAHRGLLETASNMLEVASAILIKHLYDNIVEPDGLTNTNIGSISESVEPEFALENIQRYVEQYKKPDNLFL